MKNISRKEILDELKECFNSYENYHNYPRQLVQPYTPSGNFTSFVDWLVKSNCNRITSLTKEKFESDLSDIEYECLNEILEVLIKNPQADYFWYTYPENGGKLTWAEPHHDVVSSDSIRIDKEKLKIFLRNYKLESLLLK